MINLLSITVQTKAVVVNVVAYSNKSECVFHSSDYGMLRSVGSFLEHVFFFFCIALFNRLISLCFWNGSILACKGDLAWKFKIALICFPLPSPKILLQDAGKAGVPCHACLHWLTNYVKIVFLNSHDGIRRLQSFFHVYLCFSILYLVQVFHMIPALVIN